MSPHNAVKHGADVLSLVAFDRGREKHTGGGAPTAGLDYPSWFRTSAPVKRQSRAGQLRGLRQHFYRQAIGAQADQRCACWRTAWYRVRGSDLTRTGGRYRLRPTSSVTRSPPGSTMWRSR